MLCVASDTIRVYRLADEDGTTYTALLGSYFLDSAFAFVHTPPTPTSESSDELDTSKSKLLCSFGTTGLHVITDKGLFRRYSLPEGAATECILEDEMSIVHCAAKDVG